MISQRMRSKFDAYFIGRRFQVYSIVTKESISNPATYSNTCDVMEMLGDMNGMDIREVTTAL